MMRYPDVPGHRGVDTSQAAADSVAPYAESLQRRAAAVIRDAGAAGLTADEASARLGIERWQGRPRVADLHAQGVIIDSGRRRKNASGRSAIVWVIATE